jgi:hypothetical protein
MAESVPSSESEGSPSAQEIANVIAELEQYRNRLIEDFTSTAKKAKLPKSMVMAQLENHPEIVKINASIAQLQGEQPTSVAASTSES